VTDVPAVVLRPAAGPPPFRVEQRPAGPGLVEHFWSVEWDLPPGAHHDQEVLSHPCGHVTVEDGQGWLYGVVTTRFATRLTGSGRVEGAHLRPGALSALTEDPAALVDTRVPVAVGRLEEWLDRPAKEGSELVDRAVDLVTARQDLTRVDALAAELAVPVRTLQRRFDRHLGIGPKWVLRRCRIQDALAVIETGGEVDWADLAVTLGFADQSHFTNAFTALVGVPPAAYTRRQR
jgi:AraC-like DNA-binding protein